MKTPAENIRGDLERARQNGTRTAHPVGRPRVFVSSNQIAELRRQGISWRKIAGRLGAGVGTVRRAYMAGDGTPEACQNPLASTADLAGRRRTLGRA